MCTFFAGAPMQFRRLIKNNIFVWFVSHVLCMIFHLIWFVLSSFGGFKKLKTMNIDEKMTFYVLTVYKKEFICSLIF